MRSYIPAPACVHEQPTFGPTARCHRRACRIWKRWVQDYLDAEQRWEPATARELRRHGDVLDTIARA